MKTLLTWLFFLGSTAVMAAGIAMAVNGKGMWLMILSFVAYLVLFIKFGCRTEAH